MSWQALNWASAQYIPNRSKLLLIILANHASGEAHHCYLSMECLMKETSYKRSSIYAFLAALRRNNYITTRKPKGEGRAPDIWVNLDREDAPWIKPSKGVEDDIPPDDEGDDTQDIVSSPNSGLDENGDESKDWTPGVQNLDSPLYMDSEPLLNEPLARESEPAPEPTPQALAVDEKPKGIRDSKPNGFDPKARQVEIARLDAADAARAKSQRWFIWRGTDHWKAWLDYRKRTTGVDSLPTTWQVCDDGKRREGWYFPAMRPPRATGPPAEFELMNEFEAELAKED